MEVKEETFVRDKVWVQRILILKVRDFWGEPGESELSLAREEEKAPTVQGL